MADILLEFPAFDQLFGPNIENKRAIRTAQHTLDLVDPNVAVWKLLYAAASLIVSVILRWIGTCNSSTILLPPVCYIPDC